MAIDSNVNKQEVLAYKLKQAEECENAGRFFHAAHLYKDALEIARDLGDSEKIAHLKQKMIETNQKLEGEMQTFSTNHEIPREDIDKFITSIIGDRELSEILKVIGRCRDLCPDYNALVQTAKKNMPVSYAFAKLSTISKEGHAIKGGSEPDHAWLMQIYEFGQGIIFQIFLPNLFHELIYKRGLLNEMNLMEYLKKSGIFPENILKILEIGIARYFAEDYVSALHIFIPQFEALFLSISEKLGLDTISLDRGKEISTQTRTLSLVQLNHESFQKAWGRDFCEQLKYILFEPLGYKLRHKIAHGEISPGECNFATVTLILYLFLAITAKVSVNSAVGKN